MVELECERCGATEGVRTVYGGETIELNDPWRACFECRWPILRTRVFGPEAEGPPGDVEVPE